MTDAASPASPPSHSASPVPALLPESFWSILLRRGRYAIAIALSAVIFSFLGWPLISPPADLSGVSLLGWYAMGGALVTGACMLLLLLIVTFLSTLIVHPDAPHMGLFCGLVGMAALAVRGGSSQMLLQHAQFTTGYADLCRTLSLESLVWLALLAIAEVVAHRAHDRYFANTHWITRSGAGAANQFIAATDRGTPEPIGVSLSVSRALRTTNMNRGLSAVLAAIYSGAGAFLLLYILLQSQLKGQVLFACFAAFLLSTGNAYLAFPRAPAITFFLAVPLTACVAYLWASTSMHAAFPGQGGVFVTRALPIDFVVAGVPGAILGYYAAIRWSLHSDD